MHKLLYYAYCSQVTKTIVHASIWAEWVFLVLIDIQQPRLDFCIDSVGHGLGQQDCQGWHTSFWQVHNAFPYLMKGSRLWHCDLVATSVSAWFEQMHSTIFHQQKYSLPYSSSLVSRCTDLGWECCFFNLLPPQPVWVGGRQQKVLKGH